MREAWTMFTTEISAEALQALLNDGATLLPHWVDGDFVGAGLLWGTEIHYAAHPSWRKGRLAKRQLIRDFLRPHFEELGFLTTRVQKTSKFEHDFVTRIGFKPLPTEDPVFTFYMLSELPFTKATK